MPRLKLRILSKARLITLWEAATGSYWLIPTAMACGSIVLSIVTLYLDHRLPNRIFDSSFYTASATGARSLLATIAGSLISVAGVVFSITIVALTLASNQFGPRILRNFMRDKGNQFVLGTFASSFVFCLLVLRQVHGGEDGAAFVPNLSIIIAVVFALAGIGVLIYFIHHISVSIQATNLLSTIASELLSTLDRLFPQERSSPSDRPSPAVAPEFDEQRATCVRAERGGYLQRVDHKELVRVATKRDLIVKVERRPGQFLVCGDAVLRVVSRAGIQEETDEELQAVFSIANQRSFVDDSEFAIDQLVEVGVRALSPGINDPFTAIECVDWLAEVLSHWALRQLPPELLADTSGKVRVIAYSTQFTDIIDQAFNQLRQNSASHLSVMIRLLEAIGRVGQRTESESDRQCLTEHARMIREQALSKAAGRDRRKLEARYAETSAILRSATKMPGWERPA